MFACLKNLFALKPSADKNQKRQSKTYQQRVRARERELRRQWNGEQPEGKNFYFKPYMNAGVVAGG